jgi:hypothetical protein
MKRSLHALFVVFGSSMVLLGSGQALAGGNGGGPKPIRNVHACVDDFNLELRVAFSVHGLGHFPHGIDVFANIAGATTCDACEDIAVCHDECEDVAVCNDECEDIAVCNDECIDVPVCNEECEDVSICNDECEDVTVCDDVCEAVTVCHEECDKYGKKYQVCYTEPVCHEACYTEPVCHEACYDEPVCNEVCYDEPVCNEVCYDEPVCNEVCYDESVCNEVCYDKSVCVAEDVAFDLCTETCDAVRLKANWFGANLDLLPLGPAYCDGFGGIGPTAAEIVIGGVPFLFPHLDYCGPGWGGGFLVDDNDDK